ncbi:MAG: hypothetical protein ACXVXZ_12710 [Mycobacteriaceae bacterium]
MSDMHEATAHGIRELKALFSAALMIAQARERERKREREVRAQEREMVEREREAQRRQRGGPAPTGVDANELAVQQARDWIVSRDSVGRSTPVAVDGVDLAEGWANAQVSPEVSAADRTWFDQQVRDRGVDPNEVRSEAGLGDRQDAGFGPGSTEPVFVDPEQVRRDADIRAGQVERDPDDRRIAAEDAREQALGAVQAHEEDTADLQAAGHPNGAWQAGGGPAQLAGKAYTTDPAGGIPSRLAAARKQLITSRDQARTQSRDR